MATYVNLQFINNIIISLSTSSFLFKQSKLLQSFDIDEDNTIPILCLSTYVLDENETCLFDDKPDLSFMLTLLPNKFLEVCKFLDIICYENEDKAFSNEFIIYVMSNLKEEIKVIQYFMQNEIKCISSYNDNTYLVKFCIPEFYFLYLSEYKEEVIKFNRIDIYNLSRDESEYYRYIHKYDNHLTFIAKETKEYNDYIENISMILYEHCKNITLDDINDISKIKWFLEKGADVYFQDSYGDTILHYALYRYNNLELIKYLIEQCAISYINFQNNNGNTALHYAALYTSVRKNDNIEVVKYLEIVEYLVKHGADINLQNNEGKTILDIVPIQHDILQQN